MSLDDFYFKDCLQYILENHGNEPWIILYKNLDNETANQRGSFYCALIDKGDSESSLKRPSWDLKFCDGMPGFVTRWESEKEIIEYYSNTSFSSCEPIIRYRDFHGIRDNYLEVGEEIRLFHNLYHDRVTDKYISFDDSGEEIDVIICSRSEIKIRKKYLKEFMAAKQKDLLLFFDIIRHVEREGSINLNLSIFEEENSSDSFVYTRYAGDIGFGKASFFSRLLGKKLISCEDVKKSGVYPFEKEKTYQEYIIGEYDNSDPIFYTSNPDELGDYFGGNPNAPHYLTPVFFKKDVLTRYYNRPSLSSVEDSYIRCGSLWGIRIDNNHPEYVCVFLGDLGTDLPENEQIYWKSFNTPPDGGISETYFRRSFLNQFVDPSSKDLAFKSKFMAFQKDWFEKFDWHLFLPLSEKDQHLFTSFRIPINEDQSEFDAQILAMAKLFVDSINESQLAKHVSNSDDLKGINLLEKYLTENDYPNREHTIEFLRALYGVRSSGVGHRKGTKYEKAIKRFGVDEAKLIESYRNILAKGTGVLNQLRNHFLVRSP